MRQFGSVFGINQWDEFRGEVIKGEIWAQLREFGNDYTKRFLRLLGQIVSFYILPTVLNLLWELKSLIIVHVNFMEARKKLF